MRTHALQRYEIRRELGRGGTGVVYEALDSKDGAVVALKTIDPSVADALYRLKREFRALADVQHPNLVRFGELACEHGDWFFTMELVHGLDFVDYVRVHDSRPPPAESGVITAAAAREETRTQPIDAAFLEPAAPARVTLRAPLHEGRLRDALVQLVSALSAIHATGHVHRDIKPSNVLVTGEGRVVVLDFGLVATAAGWGAGFKEQFIFGTPAYMAPEQIEGGAIGPAADWYAVGEMLYAALTGAMPFDGTPLHLYEAKLSIAPPRPRDRVPDLPADLEALCADLLATDPAKRPSEREIRARLGMDEGGPARAAHESDAPSFVGRDLELHTLVHALEEAVAGHGRKLVVEGEAGIGKTSLVQRFLRGAHALVLSGRCYEQEAVPFKGADAIVDELSEYLMSLSDEDVQAVLPEGGIRYLAAVFPVLNRVPVIAAVGSHPRPVADPASLRERAFTELDELFARLAQRRALIVFLDDIQWADRDSVALLERVLLENTACLFVATIRSGIDVPAETTAFLADAERIQLDGLSADESRALYDELLARVVPDRRPRPKEAFVREAAGHPLFLAQLVHSAHGGEEGQGQLHEVLWARVRERDAVEQRFLETVAVAGAPVAYEILAKAAEVEPGMMHTRLGSLRAAQLVRVTPRGHERLVEPYHDRLRESILSHLRDTEGGGTRDSLAARHLRLGRALLEATPEGELESGVFAIVQHMNEGRALLVDPDERRRMAALGLRASHQAQLATAYHRAREYALAGLAFLGDDPWSEAYELARDLHLELTSATYYSGDIAEARRCFEAARARTGPEADRTTLYVTWIGLETTSGQLGSAMAAGRERLAELGIDLPMQVTLPLLNDKRATLQAAFKGRGAEDLLDLPDMNEPRFEGAVKVLVALVPAAFFLDASTSAWMKLQIMEISLEHGLCEASPYGVSAYGTVIAGLFGEVEAGVRFGHVAKLLGARFHNEVFATRLAFLYGGWHASWVHPFARAKEALRDAYAQAVKHGDLAYEAYAATVLSVVTFCESADLGALQETARWAHGISLRRRDADMAGAPDVHARYAAALRGQTPSPVDLGTNDSSDAELRASLGPYTPTALFYYFFCNAELAYLFGDTSRAAALLVEARAFEQTIFGLPTTVEICLLECLVRAEQHDAASPAERARLVADVEERLERLRVWARGCPANFEPHAELASAELARMRADDHEADAAYDRAVRAARASCSPKREALALERAAAHARARDAARADRLVEEAVAAYRRWGATAKADRLSGKGTS